MRFISGWVKPVASGYGRNKFAAMGDLSAAQNRLAILAWLDVASSFALADSGIQRADFVDQAQPCGIFSGDHAAIGEHFPIRIRDTVGGGLYDTQKVPS